MKTTPPNDWSKTPDEHLKASYMGVSEQKKYLRTALAVVAVVNGERCKRGKR